MKQQLKYKVTYGLKTQAANSQGEYTVYAFDVIGAVKIAEQVKISQSHAKVTRIEQIKEDAN